MTLKGYFYSFILFWLTIYNKIPVSKGKTNVFFPKILYLYLFTTHYKLHDYNYKKMQKM